jgi:hypothetical protein
MSAISVKGTAHPAKPAVEARAKPIRTALRAEKASFEHAAAIPPCENHSRCGHALRASMAIAGAQNAIGCADRSQPDSQNYKNKRGASQCRCPVARYPGSSQGKEQAKTI